VRLAVPAVASARPARTARPTRNRAGAIAERWSPASG